MQQIILKSLGLLLILYLLMAGLIYLFQEVLIFFPKKLPQHTNFRYPYPFKEVFTEVEEGIKLHALHFRAENSKGLVFYLHGNAGALDSWGLAAEPFLAQGYDVFIPDYRGFGKSGGTIESEQQLFQDMQLLYDELKQHYAEEEIILAGFSVGSGPAAWLAAQNNPRMLWLEAPFYSLKDLQKRLYPFLPTFLLKYPFSTFAYVQKVEAPLVLIHGTADRVIPHESSLMLQKHLKPQDKLFLIKGAGHNNLHQQPEYYRLVEKVLGEEGSPVQEE